jgi:ribosome-associated translation inhibitor RaiA
MNYQITSDNIEMSPSMISLANEKMKKLENKLTSIPEDAKSFRIVMNSAKDGQFTVKIHALVNGKEYFSEESSYTLEHAMIDSVDSIERNFQKDKVISTEEEWKEAREAKHFDPEVALREEINQ